MLYVPEKDFLILETSQDLNDDSNYILLFREQNAGQTAN